VDGKQAYSGRKITESLGNVTVRGGKDGNSKRGARLSTVCLSMYSKTENIYYSQLSSVAILLQPEPVSRRIIQRKDCVLSLCAVFLRSSPPSQVSICNGQRSSQLFCVHYRYDSIKTDVKETRCESVDWIHVPQDRLHW
jgi:hypothetical protein